MNGTPDLSHTLGSFAQSAHLWVVPDSEASSTYESKSPKEGDLAKRMTVGAQTTVASAQKVSDFRKLYDAIPGRPWLTAEDKARDWMETDWTTAVGIFACKKLELQGVGLSVLPKEIGCLVNLTSLDLTDNRLSALPGEIIRLERLKALCLNQNQFKEVPESLRVLQSGGSLQVLSLQGNPIETWPAWLQTLIHWGELIVWRDPRSWEQAESLCTFYKALVSIEDKPSFLGSPQVQSVKIERCLSGTLRWRLENILSLALDNLDLKHLPPEVGLFTALNTLSIPNNHIGGLPPEIASCSQLRYLFASRAGLHTLPKEIGKLSNLNELDLSYNHLGSLPDEICQLTNLSRLNLSTNRLTYLPLEMEKLTSLKMLDLSGNSLHRLPQNMNCHTQLEFLDVSRCNLKNLFLLMEGGFPNLRTLSVHSNELFEDCLKEGQFPNLDELIVSENQHLILPPDLQQRKDQGKLNVVVVKQKY